MIEQLISSYENRLCKQELTLITNLYNASEDIKAAELLADRLASKGYGLALKRASPVDVKAVNAEIVKYDIAALTNTSREYINSLPEDVVDELIEFYNTNINMGRDDFAKKLSQIMNMEYAQVETQHSDIHINEIKTMKNRRRKPVVNKKPSLLGRLREYENQIKRSIMQ